MLGPLSPKPWREPKQNIVGWNTWRGGLNTLLRETEIQGSEMVQSTNLLLVGSGIPTKRWGSQNYFLAGATGSTRFVFPIKDANDNIQVLGLTDWGYMVKQSGGSYAQIGGGSFASGYNVEAAELNGNVYIVNSQQPWFRYNFTTLVNFPTLAVPTGLTQTMLSTSSGFNNQSWRVSTIAASGGETLASANILASGLPQDLTKTLMRITWTSVSAASGVITGYNIYRGPAGGEAWVGGVPGNTNTFDDLGIPAIATKVVPAVDSSGGINAKYIIRYQDRLVLAGIPGDPTRVYISGKIPYHERFDFFSGGASFKVDPDSGEDITGISVYYRSATSTQTVVVFKEHSVWEISLDIITFGPYSILNPTYRLLTLSQGCSSHRSIVAVENDLMFVNQRGVYILRYEPQLLNVINANELSAKIRPFFQGLSNADITSASAVYADKKYVVSFPNSKQSIMYDRERLCFMGPWLTTIGITQWGKFTDSTGVERWLTADANDNYITEFRTSYIDDKGTAMRTVFRSRKEDFGAWEMFKTINELYMNFRNVQGSVNVNVYLEGRNGATILTKSFTITSSTGKSGFGQDQFGLPEFGTSNSNPAVSSTELPKKSFLYKVARTMQIEIITTGNSDSYELLAAKMVAINQARGNSPSAWIT